MRVLYYISGYDGCGYYRIQMIAKYLNKLPNTQAKISFTYANEEISWADIVVLQKQCNPRALTFVEEAKMMKKKIISEVDDCYFCIPPTNPAYSIYLGKEQDLINFYNKSDALTVTTEYLASELKQYCSKTYVLPNSLDFKLLDTFEKMSETQKNRYTKYLDINQKRLTLEEVKETTKDKIVILWGGSPTHLKDLEQATPALIKICSEFKNVMLMMVGCTTQAILESMIQHNPEQLILVEAVPIFGYPQLLSSLRADIGICPIESNRFNFSKSNLKFLEFSANNLACVCSNVENYAKTVKHGDTGLLADNTTDSWYSNLKELILDEDKRKEMGLRAHAFVRENYNITQNINLWVDAYTELLKKIK